MMLLDEPTAGMGHEDIDRIVELIRRVAADRTVLMVEHNLSVVSTLCDIITVLRRGEVLAEGDYRAVSDNPEVIEAYMGTGHAWGRRRHADPDRLGAAGGPEPPCLVWRVPHPARRDLRGARR